MKTDNNDLERPRVVTSHDIHLDTDYADWIAELKHRYRSSQVKAAVRVNAEKLLFNWQLGRDIVQKKAEERWGAGVVEQVSMDLQREFPDADGFSVRNLWYMKKWYCFYTQNNELAFLNQLGAENQIVENQYSIKLHQLGAVLDGGNLHQPSGDSIGLLICSDMNRTDVQWSFRGINTPMGVATYNNIRIKDALPTQEQLKERMELLQRELRETKRLMNNK